MKVAVTGAAGFTGSVLTEILRQNNIEVYAFVHRGSEHNRRLDAMDRGLHIVESELGCIERTASEIGDKCDCFFHIAWSGGKTAEEQDRNIEYTLDALKAAKVLGCKRFVATGSQAEYGIVPPEEVQNEDRIPAPFTPYGEAKVKACYMSKKMAGELKIDWVWGRIFSLIGKNEPEGRMLPDLYKALREGRDFSLSSCRQNWDYLDVYDAARALLLLAEKGKSGNIYNIARGDYRPLREYVDELKHIVGGAGNVVFGTDASPFVSLQPSIEKLKADTGWLPEKTFADSIYAYGGI